MSRRYGLVGGVMLAMLALALTGSTRENERTDEAVKEEATVTERENPEVVPPKPLTEDAEKLTAEQWRFLDSFGWMSRVGDGVGVWVSVDEQVFRILKDTRVVFRAPCATGAAGTGSEMNSFKTPLGWHSVVRKVGESAVRGQVFRSRRATNEVWKRGDTITEDLVLTRILVLTGEEPGKNKGGNVDSYARNIYVHGTNAEDAIGRPSSHGCVRLTNNDVIAAFDKIPEGTPLLITEESGKDCL